MLDEKVTDIKKVNEIFKSVIKGIDKSRDQILDIVDSAREEQEYLKTELTNLRVELDGVIDLVDELQIKDKLVRNKLAKVSKQFDKYSEVDIRNAYEKATEVRIELLSMNGREKQLREKRSLLEVALRRAVTNIQNAESVVNQVTIAVNFLKGELMSVIDGMSDGPSMLVGVKILEAQENERKRISRDIHDGPAQHIANIVMKADLCEKIAQRDINKGLAELSELRVATRKALKEVRDIIFDLRPMSLDDLGLHKTIDAFVKNFSEETKIEANLELQKIKPDVESIIQVAVFRLIQEILNNVRKHSKADNVVIKIEYGTKYLRLIIIDDGVGFDLQHTLKSVREKGTSYGLLGIMERVNQLQGEIEIKGIVGEGVTYRIKLPVNREVIQNA